MASSRRLANWNWPPPAEEGARRSIPTGCKHRVGIEPDHQDFRMFNVTPQTDRVGEARSLIVKEQGLDGIGLGRSGRTRSRQSRPRRNATIEKTRGVCASAARVAGTRIPVWQLVEARSLGASEARLLIDYPGLKAVNIVDAWAYAEDHPEEIAAQIQQDHVLLPT
jgi:uncharacterized protein (DUF433 family)